VHHEEFALPFRLRPALPRGLGTQLVLAIAVTATLPSLLHLPVTAVFLLWTVAVSTIGFVVFGAASFTRSDRINPVRRSELPGYARRVPLRTTMDSTVARDDWDKHWTEYADSQPATRRRSIAGGCCCTCSRRTARRPGCSTSAQRRELAADVHAAFPRPRSSGSS